MTTITTAITDYILPSRILQIMCNKLDCAFLDVTVEFSNNEHPSFDGSAFILPINLTLPQVFWSIVTLYINNIDTISDCFINEDVKAEIRTYALALIMDFSQSHDFEDPDREHYSAAMRLDQFPVAWTLLRTIICPMKDSQLVNSRVIAGRSPFVDAAVFVDEKTEGLNLPDDIYPFIFVNLDIASPPVREAFVFIEALRAHGFDPPELINQLFGDFYSQNRVLGFLEMAFVDEMDLSNFLGVLSIMTGSRVLEDLAIGYSQAPLEKEAQRYQSLGWDLGGVSAGTWWFLGLTEKMLGTLRGTDWSAHEILSGLNNKLWNRVEQVRKKKKMKEVPFETLLRIQSYDFKNNGDRVLQGLLADNRVW